MIQCDIIEREMLENPQIKWWYAKDFQHEPYFVGYEASARMSELARMYPDLIIVEQDGRFRTLRIDWNNKKKIKEIIKEKEW